MRGHLAEQTQLWQDPWRSLHTPQALLAATAATRGAVRPRAVCVYDSERCPCVNKSCASSFRVSLVFAERSHRDSTFQDLGCTGMPRANCPLHPECVQ